MDLWFVGDVSLIGWLLAGWVLCLWFCCVIINSVVVCYVMVIIFALTLLLFFLVSVFGDCCGCFLVWLLGLPLTCDLWHLAELLGLQVSLV